MHGIAFVPVGTESVPIGETSVPVEEISIQTAVESRSSGMPSARIAADAATAEEACIWIKGRSIMSEDGFVKTIYACD